MMLRLILTFMTFIYFFSQEATIRTEVKLGVMNIEITGFLTEKYIVIIKNSPFHNDTTVRFIDNENLYQLSRKDKALIKRGIQTLTANNNSFKSKIGTLLATASKKKKRYHGYRCKSLLINTKDEELEGKLYYKNVGFLNNELYKYYLSEIEKIIDVKYDFPQNYVLFWMNLKGKYRGKKIKLSIKVTEIENKLTEAELLREILSLKQI